MNANTLKQAPNFSAKPDYGHWSRMARWDIEWLPALTLDCDPKIVSLESVQWETCPRELRDKYLARREIIENHKQAGRFRWPVEPADFLSWAKSNQVSYPQALEDAVRAQHGVIADWRLESKKLEAAFAAATKTHKAEIAALKALCADLECRNSELIKARDEDGKDLTEAERRSARTIIITMAVKRYGFMRGNEKNIVGSIVNQASELGLRIEDDTVRSWLKNSAKRLPLDVLADLRKPNSAGT